MLHRALQRMHRSCPVCPGETRPAYHSRFAAARHFGRRLVCPKSRLATKRRPSRSCAPELRVWETRLLDRRSQSWARQKALIPAAFQTHLKGIESTPLALYTPLAYGCIALGATMPTGPRGERRPADVIGAAVMVAKIAVGEIVEDSKSKSRRVRSGHAGARSRGKTLCRGTQANGPKGCREAPRLS